METKKRNYKKEVETRSKNFKVYTVQLKKEIADLFDEKLKEKNEKAANIYKQAVERYLKEKN